MTKHKLIETVRTNVLAFTDAGPRAAFVVEKIVEAAEEYAAARVEEARHPSLFGEIGPSPTIPRGVDIRGHIAGIRGELKGLVEEGVRR